MANSFNNVYLAEGPAPLTSPMRTIVDGNTDVFRYGMFRYGKDSKYEDPTILGFTIELDEDASPLFTQCGKFIDQYGTKWPEVGARKVVWKQLCDTMRKFFMSQESVVDPVRAQAYIKSHYINSVSGLSKLNNPFAKYMEDKLTLSLYEDIGLTSSHFMFLHRNLQYGYSTGREVIPANMLSFVLRIKISEIRNYTSIRHTMTAGGASNEGDPAESAQLLNALRKNTSCIIYTLWDCLLDSGKSTPFEDEITQGGIGGEAPGYASPKVDIYYKSVSRFIRSTLMDGALSMDDFYPSLGTEIKKDTTKGNLRKTADPSKTTIVGNGSSSYQEGIEVDYRMPSGPQSFVNAGIKKPSFTGQRDKEISAAKEETVSSVPGAGMLSFTMPASKKAVSEEVPMDSMGINEYERQRAMLADYPNSPQQGEEKLEDGGFGFLKGFEPQGILDKLETKLRKTADDLIEKADRAAAEKRAQLLGKFVHKIQDKLNLKKIIPENVYYGSQKTNAFDQIKSDIGFTLTDELFKKLL